MLEVREQVCEQRRKRNSGEIGRKIKYKFKEVTKNDASTRNAQRAKHKEGNQQRKGKNVGQDSDVIFVFFFLLLMLFVFFLLITDGG